jgi:uncharacterized protein YkwD
MHDVRLLFAAALAAAAVLALPAPGFAGTTDAMVAQINQTRAAHGLGPLRQSASINRSSASWARVLMRRDLLSHASLSAAGVSGEVLEMHGSAGARVAGTVRSWMNSPGHRAILMSRRFHVVGVGRATGRFGGGLATIWVGRFR